MEMVPAEGPNFVTTRFSAFRNALQESSPFAGTIRPTSFDSLYIGYSKHYVTTRIRLKVKQLKAVDEIQQPRKVH